MKIVPGRTNWRRGLKVLGLLLCVQALAWAAPPDDPFAPANSVDAAKPAKAEDDPFAPGNKAAAAPPATGAPTAVGKAPKTAELIDLKLTTGASQVRRGDILKLTIAGATKPGYYTYTVTQRTAQQTNTGLNRITFELPAGFQALAPLVETPDPEVYDPKVKDAPVILRYTKPFTWEQDILVGSEAKPGPHTLTVKLALQACDKRECVRGTHVFEVPVRVTEEAPTALLAAVKQRLALKQEIKVVPLAGKTGTGEPAAPGVAGTPQTPQGLWGVLVASMGSAVLMLLTPCVFPMIPITVSFFVKQSEKEHHRPLLTAGVYSLTIIIVLALAVLLLGSVIIKLANSPWMNLGLGAVLMFFALSLFGMYEIELPESLARFTSAREGQGGLVGAVFMALTFTITSFTCTGPFLGPLLASVSLLDVSVTTLILAALAYSATFAAPFFLLALFPTLLKALPKSGGWLNSIKVVMGFLELAAALKFLGNTDAALNPGNPWFFTYDTVLCAWIALSTACALYLLGVFRLPHDSPVESVGVMRMVLATIFLGMALYMAPALWRVTPLGKVGEWVVAFLPLDTRPRGAFAGGGGGAHELAWHMDYEKAWQEAVRDDKLIFFDFTGVNCTNCRDNENRVFPRPEVRKELEKFVRVQLYNDTVPRPGLSPSEAEKEGQRNYDWQDKTFGDVTTPLYIVFKPAKDQPFEGGKLKGVTLARTKGTIFDGQVGEFVAMLQGAISQHVAEAELDWHSSYAKAWAKAVEQRKPLLIAFESLNNTTSFANRKYAFPMPPVRKEMERYVLLSLYVDFVPLRTSPDPVKEAERNSHWQNKTFQDLASPLYVAFAPDPEVPFTDDGAFNGAVLGRFTGSIEPDRLDEFLVTLRSATEVKTITRLSAR